MSLTRQMVRVLVVDDSEEFLAGACAWVASQPGLDLVGTARSGDEAVAEVDRVHPDLVLMDVAMPGIDGLEATRRIKSRSAAPLVVMLTFHATQVARHEAWVAGADGFVAKADVSEHLLRVVDALLESRGRDRDDDPGLVRELSSESLNPGAQGRLVSSGEGSPEQRSGRTGARRRTE